MSESKAAIITFLFQDRESSDQLDSQDTESIEDDSDWDEDAVNDDEPMRTMYMPLSNEPSVYTTEGVNPQSPQGMRQNLLSLYVAFF